MFLDEEGGCGFLLWFVGSSVSVLFLYGSGFVSAYLSSSIWFWTFLVFVSALCPVCLIPLMCVTCELPCLPECHVLHLVALPAVWCSSDLVEMTVRSFQSLSSYSCLSSVLSVFWIFLTLRLICSVSDSPFIRGVKPLFWTLLHVSKRIPLLFIKTSQTESALLCLAFGSKICVSLGQHWQFLMAFQIVVKNQNTKWISTKFHN